MLNSTLAGRRIWSAHRYRSVVMAGLAAGILPLSVTPAAASVVLATTNIFTGNLVVSDLTYQGSASTVTVGQALPNNSGKNGASLKSNANGTFGSVFQNDTVRRQFRSDGPLCATVFSRHRLICATDQHV